jgi:hypothetical protein
MRQISEEKQRNPEGFRQFLKTSETTDRLKETTEISRSDH